MRDLRTLIELYLQRAAEGCSRLSRELPTDDPEGRLLRIPRLHPRVGQVADLAYEFHGRGVWIEFPDGVEVDVDVDDDGRWDCFDAWRLKLFAKSLERKEELTPDEEAKIDDGLREMLATGEIVPTEPRSLFRTVSRT